MTSIPTPTVPVIGRPVRRREDRRLVTGTGCYVADVSRPGQLWARIVRSPVAHGQLIGVDLEGARAMPGVVAAFAAADAPELRRVRIPLRLEAGEESPVPDWGLQPILASERVRFVGEPVAVIVATDPYLAESAAEQVWVDVDEEPPVLDVSEALAGGVLLHPEAGTNVNLEMHFSDGGDVGALFGAADLIVSERFDMHRHGGTPMETRGLVAEVGHDGRLTVWGSAKVKHFNLRTVAAALGLLPGRLRFLETDVGGGFGARGELYPEDYIIPWLALRLGRPVKWIEDRAESLIALNQSREQRIDLEVAVRSDGRLLAFRSRNVAALGAYMRTNGVVPPMLCGQAIHGPYEWQGYESHAIAVLTNKTPLGTFRGPGEVEATFARERMLDIVAGRLGIDPLQLRRRNLIAADAMPRLVALAPDDPEDVLRFGSGDHPTQLTALLEHVDFPTLAERHRRAGDPNRLIGVGLACSMSESGVGRSEWARIEAGPDGMFTAAVGVASVGQGIATGLSQVLADQLEVGIDRVEVIHHDTDEVAEGEGAFGDRGMIFGTGALLAALVELRRNAVAAVLDRTGVSAEQVEVRGDHVVCAGTRYALGELGACGVGRYEPGGPTHLSFCAAVATVAVDRRTGKVSLLQYAGCYDAGRAVNPLMLEGQFTGAAAQGLGGALLEESVYDDSGQPLAATFMDYVMPTASELPPIESLLFEYPEPTTPLGIKGGGNSGIICTHAAVANAVSDALRPYGAQVMAMPVRANAVRALIRSGERGA